MYLNRILILICIGWPLYSFSQTRILFDATKAETAGNADWIIDADLSNLKYSPGPSISTSGTKSNAQRIPTPAQSGINSSTPETYWKGGISAWAVDCVKQGYQVETLVWNDSITYNNSTHISDLKNYDVFVVCEPNMPFSAAEKIAMMQFMYNGGAIFMISDHNQSDRNGDGYDSPGIWNDLFTNNGIYNNQLGVNVELNSFSENSTNVQASGGDSIINGTWGQVTQVLWSSGASIAFNTSVNPSIKAVIMRNGVNPSSGVSALFVYGRFGQGRFALIGDSSPSDDGTGNSSTTLYNGYFQDAAGNHQKLLMNAMVWLASKPAPVKISSPSALTYNPNNYTNSYPNSLNIAAPSIQWNNETGTFSWVNNVSSKFHLNAFTGSIVMDSFTAPGNYVLCVKASNSKGFDTTSIQVQIYPGRPKILSVSANNINQNCIEIDSTIYAKVNWNGDTGKFQMSNPSNNWQLDSIKGVVHIHQIINGTEIHWLRAINSVGADSIKLQTTFNGYPVQNFTYTDSIISIDCEDSFISLKPNVNNACLPIKYSVWASSGIVQIDSLNGIFKFHSLGNFGDFRIRIHASNNFGSDSFSLRIHVNPQAASQFYYIDSITYLTQNQSAVLSMSPVIHWNCNNGKFIMSPSNNKCSIDSTNGIIHFNPIDTGLFTVYVQAIDKGRISQTQKYYQVSKNTSTQKLLQSNFQIYPNPFDGFIRFTCENESSDMIQLLGIDGRVILEFNYEKNNVINTSELPDGIYFLRLSKQHEVFKICKISR